MVFAPGGTLSGATAMPLKGAVPLHVPRTTSPPSSHSDHMRSSDDAACTVHARGTQGPRRASEWATTSSVWCVVHAAAVRGCGRTTRVRTTCALSARMATLDTRPPCSLRCAAISRLRLSHTWGSHASPARGHMWVLHWVATRVQHCGAIARPIGLHSGIIVG
jgi:hypothetical protein